MSSSKPERTRRRNYLRLLALQLEKIYDVFHRFLAWATGRLGKPMVAEVYHAARHSRGVSVRGRILLARKWREPSSEDPALVNLFQMLKRWATPERPNSLVRVSIGGNATEQRADREAYFEIEVPADECRSHEVLVELPASEVSDPVTHDILEVGENYRCLVVSDIDDTVLITHAARALEMIATTLFGNALTRQLFPGAVPLYQALRHGTGETPENNPIVYVTSSPFNLHGLLHLIFEENGLPLGPFFMTDWGLDVDRWLKKSHSEHKVEAILTALDWYPEVPVILIGDSGQHDTMIYVDIALTHPDRIDQILIRDVTGPDRREELQLKVDVLKESGTRFAFFSDSEEAAEILTQRGWLTPEQRDRVKDAVEEATKPLLQQIADAKPQENP